MSRKRKHYDWNYERSYLVGSFGGFVSTWTGTFSRAVYFLKK